MSGTNDQPSLVDDSPPVPKVTEICWGGENPVEGGSAALPKKFVSPSSTTSPWSNSDRGHVPMGRGGSTGCNGRAPASAPDSQMQPLTVVHESANYIVVEESPALSPLPSSVTTP